MIKEFTNLCSLNLSYGYNFKSFEKISTLSNLRNLNVSGCDYFNDTHLELIVRNAKNLTSLDLSGCLNVTHEGIRYLGQVKGLEEFYFLKCLNTSNKTLKLLSRNENLVVLKLGWCFRITDIGISYLTRLKKLKDIHLHESREITDVAFEYLSKLTQLEYIYASDCFRLTDTCCSYIEQLTNLKELHIGDIDTLSRNGILKIARNSSIKVLSLPGCRFKDNGLVALSKYARQLDSLSLSGCRGLPQISIIKLFRSWRCNLTHLSLRGCHQMSDEALALVCKIKTLESLNLGGCHQLTNASMPSISELPKVHTLILTSCLKLTDKGIAFLKDLKSLVFLDLSGCTNITDQGIFDITLSENGCNNIKQLHLFGCRNITNYCIEFIQTMKKSITVKKST